MQSEEIEELIKTGLEDAEVVMDGDGTHFTATVISDQFIDKNRVLRQQMIYNTVREQLLSGELHALSLKTFTKHEWEAAKKAG